MTTKYECNRCGGLMDFTDDKYIVVNVGAGREDPNPENKTADICPNCWVAVASFLAEGVPPAPKGRK